jgi:processive 1,2-diacylglycerol beta-glucosyltransferase
MMSTKLRILIFSATFGDGHVRSAEAIIEEIHCKFPYAEITHLDCGELLGKKFNTLLKNIYIGMITHVPKLWGEFYFRTSKISPNSLIQRYLNQMGHKDLEKLVLSLQPDIIICTYPTVAGVLAQLKLKKKLQIPLVTVVTDYVVHSQWIHQGTDMYIVGNQEVFNGLISRGINPDCIKITGIPISKGFEKQLNRAEIVSRLGLDPSHPVLLIMAGAFGVINNLKDLCSNFADTEYPVQVIVVCGRNQKLFKSLDEVIEKAQNRIIRYGYATNVEELMTAADLMVTKAGGLIVSEALTKRLPMVIYKPIPGQEEANAVFLNNIGAGKSADTFEELVSIIESLLQHPEQLDKMKQAASKAILGKAAEKAVKNIISLIQEEKTKEMIG